MQNKFGEAEMLLKSLVEENSKYMDAYDWLAKTHEAANNLDEAKGVLADAVSVSPHAVRRLRKLGDVALEVGDIDTAEKSFQKVISKAKYSEFRDPEDHVRLVRTLVKKGDTQTAASVIRDMEKSLSNLDKTPACKAFSAALVHIELGNSDQASDALTAAVTACRDTHGISNDMKMELARNCLERNMDKGASEVMRDVMSNASDETAFAKAMKVFEQTGKMQLAETVVKESRRQVVELVSSGAEKAKQGDFEGAVELMTAAVRKLPENPQVVFNAAVAVLKYLENLGWDNRLGDQARGYIESARRLDPSNPRLVPLKELYQSIMKKYGIRPVGME
jgi:tetratricopeptide (TPR) repeat protein